MSLSLFFFFINSFDEITENARSKYNFLLLGLEKFIYRTDGEGVNLLLDVSFRNEILSWLRIVLVTLVDTTVSTVLRVVLSFVKRLTYSGDDVTREESKI